MIRKADKNDIDLIRAIALTAFPCTYRNIMSPGQIEYMMEWMYSEQSLASQMSSGHTFFIEEGKGYVSYRFDTTLPDGTDVFHLEKLYILPAYQKQGLGKKLFRTVEEDIRKKTDKGFIIELNVNRSNPAIGFYRHRGMDISQTGDFPIGSGFYMTDYIMSKRYL